MSPAAPLKRARLWIYLYAALAVPLIYGASFPASPFAWIGWIGFAPWFVAIRTARTRTAIVLCCISTLLGSYFCTPWLARAVANYYQQPLAVGIALFAAVWLLTISPFLIGFTLCYRALASKPNALLPLLTAAAWTGAELGRARLLVADPFGLFGYSQVGNPWLVQIADLTGVYGLTFLPMAVSAALAELWLAHAPPLAGVNVATRAAARRGVALVVIVLLTAVAYGAVRLRAADEAVEASSPRRIAIVQANLDLGSQWREEFYGRNLEEYMRLTLEAARPGGAALVFWPESAMTFFLEEEPSFRTALASVLTPLHAQLVAGGPRRVGTEKTTQYYNSAFAIAPSGEIVASYDKQRLLPFAEYFPFGGIGLLRRHFARVREFTPGGPARLLPTRAGAAGVLICNEGMFGEMASDRVRAGADYLAILANDSWLGDPMYAAEAFDMARLRAVEQRRYLVRVSTSGPSAVVDPLGRIVTQTRGGMRATLAGEIRPLQQRTFYARWGDLFATACALAPIGCIALRRARRSRGRSAEAGALIASVDDAAILSAPRARQRHEVETECAAAQLAVVVGAVEKDLPDTTRHRVKSLSGGDAGKERIGTGSDLQEDVRRVPLLPEPTRALGQRRPAGVELAVTVVQQVLELGGLEMRVSPGWTGAVETIEVRLGDQERAAEVVVLLRAGARCEDVERCQVRGERTQVAELLEKARTRCRWETR